jgi:Flp pilus assembly pilin Flp
VTTTYSPAGISLDRSTDRLTCSGQAVTDVRVRWRMHESRKGGDKVTSFFTNLIQLRKREDGQTMAEYGVVLAVITIGVVLALGILSGAISAALERVAGFL